MGRRVVLTGLPGGGEGFGRRCSVSSDGRRLLYGRMLTRANLWRLDLGQRGGEAKPLTRGTQSLTGPDISFVSRGSGSPRVWIAGVDGLQLEEVKDSATGGIPAWLTDGRLAWSTTDNRNYRIRDLRTGREELLVKNPSVGWVFDPRFSPGGDSVLVFWNRNDHRGLWLLSWPTREEHTIGASAVETLSRIGWSADGE